MIHPMWHEYAKIALSGYMAEDGYEMDDADFKHWAAHTASDCGDIADAMCAEYDKRAVGQIAAPQVSTETTRQCSNLNRRAFKL